jgi:predicted DNA-binding ribbon-helix-helix protein
MAQKPSFGALKKEKLASAPVAPESESVELVAERQAPRIQTSVRLDPAMWAALNDLATRKRIATGRRVTMHDLLIEGGHHVLALNGVKASR